MRYEESGSICCFSDEIDELEKEIQKLQAENEKLRARLKDADSVIEFYANQENPIFDNDDWETVCSPKCEESIGRISHHHVDCRETYGKKAREYQAKYKSTTCEELTSKK